MNMIAEDVERFLDRHEVGRRLGVGGETVSNWARDGRFLAATMIGNTPRWRERDVNAWIAARAARQDEVEATAAKSIAPRRKRD